jgi:hypothetical protein
VHRTGQPTAGAGGWTTPSTQPCSRSLPVCCSPLRCDCAGHCWFSNWQVPWLDMQLRRHLPTARIEDRSLLDSISTDTVIRIVPGRVRRGIDDNSDQRVLAPLDLSPAGDVSHPFSEPPTSTCI